MGGSPDDPLAVAARQPHGRPVRRCGYRGRARDRWCRGWRPRPSAAATCARSFADTSGRNPTMTSSHQLCGQVTRCCGERRLPARRGAVVPAAARRALPSRRRRSSRAGAAHDPGPLFEPEAPGATS